MEGQIVQTCCVSNLYETDAEFPFIVESLAMRAVKNFYVGGDVERLIQGTLKNVN